MSSRVSDDRAGQESSKGKTGPHLFRLSSVHPTNTAGSNTKELASDLSCPGPNIILQMPGPQLAPRRHVSDVKC